jgi:hypothetical protein
MHMMWPERRGHLYDGAVSAGWRAIRPYNCNKESQDRDFTIFPLLCIANLRNTLYKKFECNYDFTFQVLRK